MRSSFGVGVAAGGSGLAVAGRDFTSGRFAADRLKRHRDVDEETDFGLGVWSGGVVTWAAYICAERADIIAVSYAKVAVRED